MENVQLGEVNKTIQKLLDREKGQKRGCQLPPSISMVPRMYRDQKPSCFDPQVISIGPFHRAHTNVQEHEGLKATYLHDFLARLDSPPKQILEACLLQVIDSIEEIKVCYQGTMKYDDFELANMMVIDGCFILEFLQKCFEGKALCSLNRFVISHVTRDLVLLENQIPFFVLRDIFDCTLLKYASRASLLTLILNHLLYGIKPFEARPQIVNHSGDRYYYKHILDILLKAYQPACVIPSQLLTIPISHSAVELHLAGVNFKPNRDGNWPMAMEYESSGLLCFPRSTLRMPVVNIHDNTELVLRNLIAYEQSCPNGYYFTSYCWAMNMLVSNAEDVIKLVESKVLVNYLGSNEIAANLITSIGNEVFCYEFSYLSQWKQLDDYYNCYWPKNIAWLRRTYFNSPWKMIALVAVIILFALSVTQTYFTVKSAL